MTRAARAAAALATVLHLAAAQTAIPLGAALGLASAPAQNFTAPAGGCFVTATLTGGGGGNAPGTSAGGAAASFSATFFLPAGVILSASVGAGGAAFGPLVVGIASDGTGSLISAMYVLIVPMAVGGLLTLSARGFFESDARRVLEEARR